MKAHRCIALLVLTAVLLASPALAQIKITIPAGTPEDQALTAISNEPDAEKRIPMLEEFVQKFASNRAAVAYGNWQLAQQYMMSDPVKALACGDKALAAMPDVVDILMFQIDMAQQLKDYVRLVDYAARVTVVTEGLLRQPKPEGMSDQDFAQQGEDQRKALQSSVDYAEAAGYNAIAAEPDARKRLKEINQYMAAFSTSKFAQQVATLAIVSFQEAKDTAGLAAFGDKMLAKNPDDMRLLCVLANAYAAEPAHMAKAAIYARKAIELEKTKRAGDGAGSLAGVAHSVLGRVLLGEGKFPAAVAELKSATTMLTDSPDDRAGAFYYLGFTYAKMERAADAINALTEASNINGPYQQPAQDLLAKIKAARARPRK
jgi:tetratricopeptide (TPR) repeat protein